jgi:hypothetical protein
VPAKAKERDVEKRQRERVPISEEAKVKQDEGFENHE